ncbi:MAG: transcription elongation factor GreB [Alphaproteobacteria bacterium]|nr:transcription elongation factor GreB [Alphaproteobacteria bacterium]
MNKAFTKEDDGGDENFDPDEISDTDLDAQLALPSGVKNYLTEGGFRKLRDELEQLARVERPKIVEIVGWAAGNGDRSENGDYLYGKRRLREIDRRIRFLTKRLESAEVVDTSRQKNLTKVFFGATVSYDTEDGSEHTVRLVGVDEADPALGKISWRSPVALALLKAEIGDQVRVRTPSGVELLEVTAIRYEG